MNAGQAISTVWMDQRVDVSGDIYFALSILNFDLDGDNDVDGFDLVDFSAKYGHTYDKDDLISFASSFGRV